MDSWPLTRPSLLVRMRDGNDEGAWCQFVDVYAPLVYHFFRKHGLQDADAADLTQDVLTSVARNAARFHYDAQKGRFRGWLFTIVRNRLRNYFTRMKPDTHGSGDSKILELLEEQPAGEDRAAESWDQEYASRLLAWASHQVRGAVNESTWQAFWQTAKEGKSGEEVARNLG